MVVSYNEFVAELEINDRVPKGDYWLYYLFDNKAGIAYNRETGELIPYNLTDEAYMEYLDFMSFNRLHELPNKEGYLRSLNEALDKEIAKARKSYLIHNVILITMLLCTIVTIAAFIWR